MTNNTTKAAKSFMLTTVDNPYNPFTNYDKWYAYDVQKGHHTCALLGRIVKSSLDLSENEQEVAIDQAIDEIVRENVSGVHRKVEKNST